MRLQLWQILLLFAVKSKWYFRNVVCLSKLDLFLFKVQRLYKFPLDDDAPHTISFFHFHYDNFLYACFSGDLGASKVRYYLADLAKGDPIAYVYTPLPIVTSTVFFLNVTYSGTSTKGCGLTFNIAGTPGTDIMYHLDFRMNYKHMYEKLIQGYRIDGAWKGGDANGTRLHLKMGENGVKVEVGSSFFKVWINGVKFREIVPVDPATLLEYNHVSLIRSEENGSCASFDLKMSFVEFPFGE